MDAMRCDAMSPSTQGCGQAPTDSLLVPGVSGGRCQTLSAFPLGRDVSSALRRGPGLGNLHAHRSRGRVHTTCWPHGAVLAVLPRRATPTRPRGLLVHTTDYDTPRRTLRIGAGLPRSISSNYHCRWFHSQQQMAPPHPILTMPPRGNGVLVVECGWWYRQDPVSLSPGCLASAMPFHALRAFAVSCRPFWMPWMPCLSRPSVTSRRPVSRARKTALPPGERGGRG